MSEHTPGPWFVSDGESVCIRDTKEDGRLCTINWLRGPFGNLGRRDADEGMANARLIAAAPEMLAALKALVGEGREGALFSERIALAKAAIAKAEGRDAQARLS